MAGLPSQLINDQPLYNAELYTAISRKVVGKIVHATIAKGKMEYDQYTFLGTVASEPTFVPFL